MSQFNVTRARGEAARVISFEPESTSRRLWIAIPAAYELVDACDEIERLRALIRKQVATPSGDDPGRTPKSAGERQP